MKNLFLYISVLLCCASCASADKPAETKKETAANTVTLTDAQMKNADIEIGAVQTQDLNDVLKVNGLVDVPPQNIVSVSFPLGGYLKHTTLLPGMHINKGQVIGVIEDQGLVQLQQDYLMAQARLRFLQQEYDRQKELSQQQVSAAKTFQQVQADFTAQKVLVKGFAEKLRLININPGSLNENNISRSVPMYSPINGFVSKVNVNIGKFVNATDVLFELINPDDIHAALTVFEKDMPKIKTGQRVKVSFVDEPGREYDCEVILVTRNVDINRSGTIHCHFIKRPGNLLPGMFLNATIHIENVSALTVPEEAVVRYGNQQYIVKAIGKNNFQLVDVETGIREKELVAISSKAVELKDMQVVTKNAYAVLGKMKNASEEE
ncbi:efflux transporter periplasmic adaptor subunit [Niastella yeongjuensis]|uniref:Efflux transporter periplasmic adaptor subunit n=1 Tax=Niastella yeongjuensis TaxID=354355 RepID=A0A1V9F142_9BACT|nr:efflux RND transporter periplasmic adaptor subunit [Niastella yeongjuensis]OQP52061.1 efflux transporter periplasmic adaptor subunit [Niastella yeongjuensis]SEP37098.1 membrane fusion protein, cobalt-zinc-cadmium efflux system [Niastella yeongjuensis]